MTPPKLQIERAIDELRRGRAIVVDNIIAIMAVDFLTDDTLNSFENSAGVKADILVSARRATALKLDNSRTAAGAKAVRIARSVWQDVPALVSIADPVDDMASPLKGPFKLASLEGYEAAATAAIALMKQAALLPAALIAPCAHLPADWLSVSSQDVSTYPLELAQSLLRVAEATVPLASAETCRLVAFRSGDGGLEHLAIIIGDPPRHTPVLTRLHSECFTGDLLGSLKCDCGTQLQAAISTIAAQGSGVLLYLAQEGRGIGLINKLRAYALQDQGFDTVDANWRLGFETDERLFAPAARMLELLGFETVRLMTNNTDKVAGLEALGIKVSERVPHSFPANPHNAHYLATKKDRTGHQL